MENKRQSIQRMTRISIFASLIAVSSLFSLSIFVIPFTLQLLMIVLAAMVLSPGEAFWSVVVYLILGILGLPVFSGFKSGIEVLAGPTGGFLLAFPLVAYLIGKAKDVLPGKQIFVFNILVGIGFLYLCGVGFLSFSTKVSFLKAAKSMIVYFLIDLVKIVIATAVGLKIKKHNIFTT